MNAKKIEIREQISASKKLGIKEARDLLKAASKLVVAKGKKVDNWNVASRVSEDALKAMLGPTGNLRAPCLRTGKTVVVGFSPEVYEGMFR